MSKRMELFEKYTLPGMRAQTNQNFKWLVQFDVDTPEVPDFDYGNIIICHERGAKEYLDKHVRDKWIITSRLDNDDYYEPTFVEEIQRCFDMRELLIDIGGRQLDHKTGKFYQFPKYSMDSPFISLIEKRKGGYRTVKCHNHGQMKRHFRKKYINKKLVVQVIHDTNEMNRLTKIEE